MTSSAVHTPAILTEIRLFDREKKIQIWNRVHKEPVQAPEGVYFAFPFAARALPVPLRNPERMGRSRAGPASGCEQGMVRCAALGFGNSAGCVNRSGAG